jgi:hypothetical protein
MTKMADPVKDLSTADAKKAANDAIRNGAQKVTLERQDDGKWTVTIV